MHLVLSLNPPNVAGVILPFLRRCFGCRVHTSPPNIQPPIALTDAETQFQTGLRFASAGAAHDYAEAERWYAQAAEQDHALAQFNLAVMYAQGQGMVPDKAKSVMWMTRAAKLGDAGAQYQLGMQQQLTCREENGKGASEKRIEAFKWARLAAAQGYRGAERAAESLALGMTFEEVAEAGRRVDAFASG